MKNRGMFLEYILNTTINFYNKHNLAWFEKKLTPVVSGRNSEKTIWIRSTTDYYGVYNGRYISIEAKSFETDRFSLSNIKKHQSDHLKKIIDHGGIGIYIFYSDLNSRFYFVDAQEIHKLKTKSIKLEYFDEHFYTLTIEIPGIIDFLPLIEVDEIF